MRRGFLGSVQIIITLFITLHTLSHEGITFESKLRDFYSRWELRRVLKTRSTVRWATARTLQSSNLSETGSEHCASWAILCPSIQSWWGGKAPNKPDWREALNSSLFRIALCWTWRYCGGRRGGWRRVSDCRLHTHSINQRWTFPSWNMCEHLKQLCLLEFQICGSYGGSGWMRNVRKGLNLSVTSVFFVVLMSKKGAICPKMVEVCKYAVFYFHNLNLCLIFQYSEFLPGKVFAELEAFVSADFLYSLRRTQ